MAFIQVDPKQKNATIALIGALALAIGFVVWRLTPQDEQAQSAVQQQTQQASAVTPISIKLQTSYDPARNPFERPAGLKSNMVTNATNQTQSRLNAKMTGSSFPGDGYVNGDVSVAPASVPELPANATIIEKSKTDGSVDTTASKTPECDLKNKDQEPKKTFTLLATVKSGAGYSALIKSSDTAARVVDVGDVLSGFRVKKLESGRAVLSDGKETIIATRPQS